eukprot:536585-Amphidinium_carterae.1
MMVTMWQAELEGEGHDLGPEGWDTLGSALAPDVIEAALLQLPHPTEIAMQTKHRSCLTVVGSYDQICYVVLLRCLRLLRL